MRITQDPRREKQLSNTSGPEYHPAPLSPELSEPDDIGKNPAELSQPRGTIVRDRAIIRKAQPQPQSSDSSCSRPPGAPVQPIAPAQPHSDDPEASSAGEVAPLPAVQSVTRPLTVTLSQHTWNSARKPLPRGQGLAVPQRLWDRDQAGLQSSQMCPSCGHPLTPRTAAGALGPSCSFAGTAQLRWGSCTPRSAGVAGGVTAVCREADGNYYSYANSMEISMCLGKKHAKPSPLPRAEFHCCFRGL